MDKSKSQNLFWVVTDELELTIFTTKTGNIKTIIHLNSDSTKDELRKLVQIEKSEIAKKMKSYDEFLTKVKSDIHQKVKIDFDESESLIVVPTLFGIGVFDLVFSAFVKVIGAKEKGDVFIGVVVFQGDKMSDTQGVIGQGGISSQNKERDTLVFVWCFKKSRFCIFSKRNPELETKKGEANPRDVINEKIKQNLEQIAQREIHRISGIDRVVISTTLGDIHVKLFPQYAPKTVENFVTHCKNGYYDNCLFHRVVKGYIQGGDPLNDGTGGESIWGTDFEDEICPELRHDKPFTVSMANSGPNTNGSQFFITTIPSQWLDNKHTIFGRVFKGTEVVTEIEGLKCDNFEKPLLDVRIMRITPI